MKFVRDFLYPQIDMNVFHDEVRGAVLGCFQRGEWDTHETAYLEKLKQSVKHVVIVLFDVHLRTSTNNIHT